MTASGQQALGILGGTFDPVHMGHLRLAIEVRSAIKLHEVQLVPVSHPPHKPSPTLDAATRLRLLEAAIADQAGLAINRLELEREGVSYTCDTLRHLREQYPQTPLCLILGMDAFASLPTWSRWREIPDLAHLVIAQRPGSRMEFVTELGELLAERQIQQAEPLHEVAAGLIMMLEIPPLDISSSKIRAMIKAGISTSDLLPPTVKEIIEHNEYYRASSDETPTNPQTTHS